MTAKGGEQQHLQGTFDEICGTLWQLTVFMHDYVHTIDCSTLSSTQDVLDVFDVIKHALVDTPLAELHHFNDAYRLITEDVAAELDKGFYMDPETMDLLSLNFAKLYFEVLNYYVKHKTLPSGWKRVIGTWFGFQRPRAVSLLFGAACHIHEDLLPALQESVKHPREFEKDYHRVDVVLLKSTRAILPWYARGFMWLTVLPWRHKIWNEFVADSPK